MSCVNSWAPSTGSAVLVLVSRQASAIADDDLVGVIATESLALDLRCLGLWSMKVDVAGRPRRGTRSSGGTTGRATGTGASGYRVR